jgi:hypothetical protein
MGNDKELRPNSLKLPHNAGTPTRASLSFERVVKQTMALFQELQAQQLMLEKQDEDIQKMRAEKQELEDILREYRKELNYWASLGPARGVGHG